MPRGFAFNNDGTFEEIDGPKGDVTWATQEPPDPPKPPPKPEPKKEIVPRRERFPGRKSVQTKSGCPLTKEQRANKPPYAKDPDKWYNSGGKITIDKNGTWTYHDWEKPPNSVSYPDGYPDFKSAGLVKQEVAIGKFEGYQKDFLKADKEAPNGPKADTSTWHHHQDGTTMQEVDAVLHARFTHQGGMSRKRKKGSMVKRGGMK